MCILFLYTSVIYVIHYGLSVLPILVMDLKKNSLDSFF